MSSAIATHSFAANVLRVGARNAGRTAPSRANRMTVRAAASNGGLAIDLRGAFHFSRRRDFVCGAHGFRDAPNSVTKNRSHGKRV